MESWSGKDITPEIWGRVKPLFEAASEMDAAQRPAFLAQNCPDQYVRAEVEKLLANHDKAAGFLAYPALSDLPFLPVEPNTSALAPGTLLTGRFKIIRFIARGGMGEVYEVEDLELHERLAVKILRPEVLQKTNAIERFKREVHLARRVTHPNVCRVFDLFRDRPDGTEEIVFITMEFLRGETLAGRMRRRGRMSKEESLPLITQMADALSAAHEVGIVHRDFKPGNVVLVDEPAGVRAVITDFGLAFRGANISGEHSLSGASWNPISTTGELYGTPAYMAPEQIEGHLATAAADIYALGLVIYEMVTGERPFSGETPMSAAVKRLVEAPPSPRKFDPTLNHAWELAILRCLERDPTKRFSNAKEIVRALAREDVKGFPRGTRKVLIPAAILVIVIVMVGGLYNYSHKAQPLSDRDTIVLADFANRTGDPVFDDTLKTALNVSLRQSPFLNVFSDREVTKTLQLMTRPASTKLTPDVAHELCQRADSKAYIAGSIGSLGREYVLGLKAVNCHSGDTLAEEQVTAVSKEKVLDALGEAASKLRAELGESLATVQKFDVPLAEATTSSLEALKAFSLGMKAYNEKGAAAALPYHQRAIELDPNFALGYSAVGGDYGSLAEVGRAGEYETKAFQLREHTSEREKLSIAAHYYRDVTGDLDKAARTYEEEIVSYPRESVAYINLGNVYGAQGQYAKAVEITKQGIHISPNRAVEYANLANYYVALQRFDETRQTIQESRGRKLDHATFHNALYALAFLAVDSTAMGEQQHWFSGKPDYENWGLALASDTEAYAGRLHNARELTKQGVDFAIRADSKETGAIWQAIAAQREAAYGKSADGREMAEQALKLAPASQGVEAEAALAFAMAGNSVRAESLAHDIGKRFPLDTQMQWLWLPAIQMQLALNKKNSTSVLSALQTASPIELGQISFVLNISCLYPTYVRGEAYLAVGQGSAAAAEFQKILDHSGIVWNCWTGALAHLGVARANALEARTSQGADADAARVRALAAYKDFLTRWKDADPDIPILKQAKAEYAKLR